MAKGKRPKKEMEKIKDEFKILMKEGGSITRMDITTMAKYMRISIPTMSKWLNEGGFRRWH